MSNSSFLYQQLDVSLFEIDAFSFATRTYLTISENVSRYHQHAVSSCLTIDFSFPNWEKIIP